MKVRAGSFDERFAATSSHSNGYTSAQPVFFFFYELEIIVQKKEKRKQEKRKGNTAQHSPCLPAPFGAVFPNRQSLDVRRVSFLNPESQRSRVSTAESDLDTIESVVEKNPGTDPLRRVACSIAWQSLDSRSALKSSFECVHLAECDDRERCEIRRRPRARVALRSSRTSSF